MSEPAWTTRLRDRVPELAAVIGEDATEAQAFAALGRVAADAIRAGGQTEHVGRVFVLVDELAAADDERVDNWLVTQFFEVLADHPMCREVARDHLGERACELLRIATAFWR